MRLAARRGVTRAAVLAPLLGVALWTAGSASVSAQTASAASAARTHALPDRLSDAEFWKLVSDISEPDDYFRITDNFTSNEPEVGTLFTGLRVMHVEGDVYMGVGPEQNLSYMAAVRPRMAFICDIRRQAVMQHLMFKAVFEMARDRADFVSLLFGKPRPAGLDTAMAMQKMWEAYSLVPRDSALSNANYVRVVERLTKTHGFTFTAAESGKLKWVFDAFQTYGPAITTQSGSSSGGRGGGGRTFSDLTGYSTDSTGQVRSFLSSEDNYQFIKSLHEKNLIVPVSGNFGGTKAIRAIGAYLKEHGATVRAFYVSNVEQYLFQDGLDRAFYSNVATLPVDSASVFIRPYSMRRSGEGTMQPLCPIAAFMRSVSAGRINTNNDALTCVSVPPPSH